jgi:UDP:flavonoid glycosyltransferase YjiC (YdhE family)
MKIAILTYGSQGDVEPFIALGHRFCSAGHQVRLAGPEVYQSRFDLKRIEYIPLPGEPSQLVQDLVDQSRTNRIGIFLSMSKFIIPLAVQVFESSRVACQDADLILHSFLLTSTGIELGKELGIPTISAQLFPVFSTTSAFPAPTFPDLPLGGGYRRLTHKLVSQTFKWGSRYLYQRVRKDNPHLPELTTWIPGDLGSAEIPILYGFSSHVVPQPSEWGKHTHLTGYWTLNNEDESEPAPAIRDFLEAGSPPFTVAFGSTQSKKLGDITRKVLTALTQSKQRVILVSGHTDPGFSSPEVLQVDYVPYNWLFERSAAIIHHGGAGTTARGLMAGVPTIILPFTSDQPFWGRRVYALGAGPRPLPARNLTVKALTEAIDQALKDQEMRKSADRISKQLKKEDGTSQALKIIQEYLESINT